MAYVYRHIRRDKNVPFYIGIGTLDDNYARANNSANRSTWWKRIANKEGYDVEIMLDGITAEEAKRKEAEFIELYGRSDMGLGTLCNMTNGGEGDAGFVMPETARRILSQKMKGRKPHKNCINAVIAANTGRSPAKKSYERFQKAVTNIETNVVYDSVKIAAKEEGLNYRTLLEYLNGKLVNKTPLRYVDGDKSIFSKKKANRELIGKRVIDTSSGVVYPTIKIAAEANGYTVNQLYQWLRGKRKNKSTLSIYP